MINFLVSSIGIFIELINIFIFSKTKFYYSFCGSVIVILFCVFFFSKKISINDLRKMLSIISVFITYYFFRFFIGGLSDVIGRDFGVVSSKIGLLVASFSVGYGLMQLVSGYIFTNLGFFGCSISFIFASLCCFSIYFCRTFTQLRILHFFLGASLFQSSSGFSLVSKMQFSIDYMSIGISSISILILNTANLLNNFAVSNYITQWRLIYLFLGFTLLLAGFIIFENKKKQIGVKNLSTLNWHFLLLLGFFCGFSANAGYFCLSGPLKLITTNGNYSLVLTDVFKRGIVITSIIIPILIRYFGYYLPLLILSLCQIIGIVMFLKEYFQIGVFLLGLTIKTHILVFMMILNKYDMEKSSRMIGILNFFSSFCGAFLSQYLGSFIVNFYCSKFNNSILAIKKSLMCFLIPGILSIIFLYFIFIYEKKRMV